MAKRIGILGLALVGCGSHAGSGDTTEVRTEAASLVETLSQETVSAWEWTSDPELGTPAHVAGRSAPLLAGGASARDATFAFLSRFREQFDVRDPAGQFTVSHEQRDELGMTHVRLQQVERGIPVKNAEMSAHYDRSGALRTIDSNYVAGLEQVDIVPAVTAERALVRAREELRNAVSEQEAQVDTAPELVIHALDDASPALAYHIVLRTDLPALHRMDYLIDAHTGSVLRAYDDIQTAEGSGQGVLGDTKTLQISVSGGEFTLDDRTRTPNGIRTFTAKNLQSRPGTLISSTSSTSWDRVSTGAGAAVDAHFYAGAVYDYYKSQHNRLGIDGEDGALVSLVHFDTNFTNALWDGTQMVYGDGDGSSVRALSVGLDVVGHELTHGVTQHTSKLVYQKQSGAINESISDIFGSIIEHAFKPDETNNYLLGEALYTDGKPLRDLAHPGNVAGAQPAHMSKFVNTVQDNGGVHINSGIPNNAFYLMTNGGTNDASNIEVASGIGWDRAAQLWYRTQTKYLLSSSNFAALANGTLMAASDLEFSQNEKNIIECAWIAVGVISRPGCRPIRTDAANDGGVRNDDNPVDDEDLLHGSGASACAIGAAPGASRGGAFFAFGGIVGWGMWLTQRRIRRRARGSRRSS